MRRAFSVLVLAGLLLAATASPALAFHHTALPADECAPLQAGTPGNNPIAHNAIEDRNPAQSLPLPPAGTPAVEASPIIINPAVETPECPAPQK